jgi:hypothetical protein
MLNSPGQSSDICRRNMAAERFRSCAELNQMFCSNATRGALCQRKGIQGTRTDNYKPISHCKWHAAIGRLFPLNAI